jgi:hypothetical protein
LERARPCLKNRSNTVPAPHHVYIARAGFEEAPFSMEEWLAAARRCDALEIKRTKTWKLEIHEVFLRGNRRAWLSLRPYGLILAQRPDKPLVEVMFRLAELLDAGVYSLTWNEARDSLIAHDRFASVEDWDQRTAEARLRLQQRRADFKKRRAHYRKQRRIRFIQMMLFIAVSVLGLVGWSILSRHWYAWR